VVDRAPHAAREVLGCERAIKSDRERLLGNPALAKFGDAFGTRLALDCECEGVSIAVRTSFASGRFDKSSSVSTAAAHSGGPASMILLMRLAREAP
jgi:hypothetical protein